MLGMCAVAEGTRSLLLVYDTSYGKQDVTLVGRGLPTG